MAVLLSQMSAELRRDPAARRELIAALGLEFEQQPARYVTVNEFAAARSLGRSTVRRAIAEQRLEVHRTGRSVRIKSDAVISERVRAAEQRSKGVERAEARLGLTPMRGRP